MRANVSPFGNLATVASIATEVYVTSGQGCQPLGVALNIKLLL